MEAIPFESTPSLDLTEFRGEKLLMPKYRGKIMIFLANVRKDWISKEGCHYCHDTNNLKRSDMASAKTVHD